MNLTIERALLLKAVELVRGAVSSRNTIPILSNVRLQVAGGCLRVTATDLDIESEVVVPASGLDGGADGETTVPASTLYDLIRKLPLGGEVNLAMDRESARLNIACGRSTFKLPSLPAGDFPTMSADGMARPFTIKAADLAGLLDNVMFAMSTEETRYYLNGAYMEPVTEGGVSLLRFVSTDGHRMALAEATAPDGASGPGVIIPRKTVKELRRLLDGADNVSIAVGSSKIRVVVGATTLTSKLIDGAFPDYRRVIPRDNERHAVIDPALLASAVDRVATISSEKSRSVKLNFDDGKLILTVRNMEAGQAVEEVEVDFDGSIEIGFNARYVLDIAQRAKGEEIVIEMGDPTSPARVLDRGNPGVQWVLMPLRT